jgi:DNA-binding winged helix-turn-helix (wHTH) protein/tetratricopeptide (TPR) repeat protein
VPGAPRVLFGNCQIDGPSRTLLRNGEAVGIQPKVFDLLLYLIENRDRVVSTEELLDAFWNSVAVTPSSLARAVHKARVAVGDDGHEQRIIETVHDRGFRFVAPLRCDEVQSPEQPLSDFVGREYELGCLDEALGHARSGRGALVFLTGEPGIGKTRTAYEFSVRAPASGVDAHMIHCHAAPETPLYWPWRRLARAMAVGRNRSELERLAGREGADFARVDAELALATGSDRLPSLPPEELHLRLFDAAVTVLERIAREKPLVLLLDDLHLADLPSLQFLRFLAHSLPELPILLVGTLRDAELALDENRRSLLAEAARSAGAKTLPLSALSEAEVGWLTEKRLRRALADETRAALLARSGGNPFFLSELLNLTERDGNAALVASSSVWPQLPPTVRAAVEGQLGRLGEDAKRLLGVAAVFGMEFSPGLLSRTAGESAEAVMRYLDAAVDAHLIEPPNAKRRGYRFVHGLLHEALYEDMEASARARLHLRVVEALEENRHPDVSQLAFHSHRAAAVGGAERAVHYACQAARLFRSRLELEQASHHMEQALEAIELLPAPSTRRRCELLIEAASCATDFDLTLGETLLLDALRLSRGLEASGFRALLPTIVSAAAEHRLSPEELALAVKDALNSFDRYDVDAQLALLAAVGRDALRCDPEARALSGRAVELARASGDRSRLGTALCAWCWLHPEPESHVARREVIQEIEGLGPAIDQATLLEGRFLRVADALELGGRHEFLTALEALEVGAREAAHPLSSWRGLACRSMLATVEGRVDEAARVAARALALGRRHGRGEFDPFLFDRDRQYRCAHLTREVEPLGEGLRASASRAPGVLIPELRLARWYTEMGDPGGARACLERCSRAELCSRAHDLGSIQMLVPVANELRDLTLCEALRPTLLPYRGLHLVQRDPFCSYGPGSHYLALVSGALEDWERASEYFHEAIASCEALGATAEALLVRTDFARMLVERGRRSDRRAARAELALARSVADLLQLPGVTRRLARIGAWLGEG